MTDFDDFDSPTLQRLQMFLYLIPVFGFLPALWTLYRRQGSRQQQLVSRLAVTLALGWVISYALINATAQAAGSGEFANPSLLLLSGVLTSGYFLTNFWLMVRLWQHQPLKVPGVSNLAKRLPLK